MYKKQFSPLYKDLKKKRKKRNNDIPDTVLEKKNSL